MATSNREKTYGNFYKVWQNMRFRCHNPNCKAYKYYGGKGVTICKRWDDFLNFVVDMYPSYKQGLTLDRIDSNGNYEPNNCRWTTQEEQVNNTSKNRFITHNGITLTLSQWAKKVGIKRSTLAQRYYVYKWDFSKCLKGGYNLGNI